MAITNNGVVNNLHADQLPSGYTRPTVTTFTDYEYTRTLTLSVLKSTVENATPSTTMTNIIENGTIGLEKQIIDIVAATFISSQTVTTYGSLNSLTTNQSQNSSSETWLDNIAQSYTATVVLYIKSV